MSSIIKASTVKVENVEVFDYKNHEELPPKDYSSEDSEIIQIVNVENDDDDFLYDRELDEEVRERVERILSKAKEEAMEIKKNAEKQGYEEGYEQSKQDVDKFKFNLECEYNERLIGEVEKIQEENNEYIRSVRLEIAEMIINMSKSLVSQSLKTDNELILDIITLGLVKIGDASQISIKLCKDDFDVVTLYKSELQKYYSDSTKINLIVDDTMSEGDCIIETPFGIVNCGVSAKLNSMISQLEKVLST